MQVVFVWSLVYLFSRFHTSSPLSPLSSLQQQPPATLPPSFDSHQTNEKQDTKELSKHIKTRMNERLTALETSSRRLASVDFSAPRLYSSLLLENQAVPIRNAKSFEQNLFTPNRIETLRKYVFLSFCLR